MSSNIYKILSEAFVSKVESTHSKAKTVATNQAPEPIVLLSKFPIIIDPIDYKNAVSTGNPGGDLRSLWRFRQLVDPLPQFTNVYIPGPLSTETTYTQIVTGALAEDDNLFVSDIIGDAIKAVQAQTFANMDGTVGHWCPVYAVPDDWVETIAGTKINEISIDLAGIVQNNDLTLNDKLFWRIVNADKSFSTIPIDLDSTINSAKIKYIMVSLNRPWLNTLIFETAGWYLKGQSAGFCSSGKNDGSGVMPLIPTSIIVGTDVSIDAKWSAKDTQIINDAKTNNQQLYIGPLLVNGTQNTSPIYVLGWVMSQIPFSPQISKDKDGVVKVKNTGAFVAKFTVNYVQKGNSLSFTSGNFPALTTKELVIPSDAVNILITIEIMTWPVPETWSTIASYKFDATVEKFYELSQTTVNPYISEVPFS